MKSSVSEHIKAFKANKRHERLVAEARAERLLSEKMRAIRESTGLTQTDLGERLGRPQSFVSKLEQGGFDRCTISTLTTVARAMGYGIDVAAMFVPLEAAVFSHELDCDSDTDADKFEALMVSWTKRNWAHAKGAVPKQYAKTQLVTLADDTPVNDAELAAA